MSRRKHDAVETLPMFDEPERVQRKRSRGPKSVAFGSCPCCSAQRVGLVRQSTCVVWREHTYRTYSGAALTCRASGVALHVAPAAHAFDDSETPHCPCGADTDKGHE